MGEPRGSLGGALGEFGDQFVIYGQRLISSQKPHVLKPGVVGGAWGWPGGARGGFGGAWELLGAPRGDREALGVPSESLGALGETSGEPRAALGEARGVPGTPKRAPIGIPKN